MELRRGRKPAKRMPALGANTDGVRAAEYVRMSTDLQRYSTANQRAAIRAYADERGIEIVKTYADEGRSGLTIDARKGLQALLQDVESGAAGIQMVLVYDISRWGRFQDTDESAYYEFVCRRAGVAVAYCAEPFHNDGSTLSNIIKGIKRAMAAEYSRELSVKVSAGKRRLVEMGFHQGAFRGYGFRRMLVDEHGRHKSILLSGQAKAFQRDRVILVLGPKEEQKVVAQMYQWLIDEQCSFPTIARRLNAQGIKSIDGRLWTRNLVWGVLTNEKYMGNIVYNRTSGKLGATRKRNPAEQWVRKDNGCEGLISKETFQAAQLAIRTRDRLATDEELLDNLRKLYLQHGYLSIALVESTKGIPHMPTYRVRFGGISAAYALIGYEPTRKKDYIDDNPQIYAVRARLTAQIKQEMESRGATVKKMPHSDLICVNNEFTFAIHVLRSSVHTYGTQHWQVKFGRRLTPDIRILVRTTPKPDFEIIDYFLIPPMGCAAKTFEISYPVRPDLARFRHENLDALYKMAEQAPLRHLSS